MEVTGEHIRDWAVSSLLRDARPTLASRHSEKVQREAVAPVASVPAPTMVA